MTRNKDTSEYTVYYDHEGTERKVVCCDGRYALALLMEILAGLLPTEALAALARIETPFLVIRWDDSKVASRHSTMETARQVARAMGHNGYKNGKWMEPVAFVGNDKGELLYNPHFRAED